MDSDAFWDELTVWTYVHASTAVVTAFVLAVFGFTSLFVVRTRSDPARLAFRWMKLAFVAEVIGLPLLATADFADDRVQAWRGRPWRASGIDSYNTITLAYDVMTRTGSAGRLFIRVSDVLLAITLVELGNGLMFALTKERRTSQKALRWTTISMGVILVILAIAHTALQNGPVRDQWYAVLAWSETDSRVQSRVINHIESYAEAVNAYRRLGGAYNVISFCLNLGVMVYASVIMHYYTKVKPRTSAINYLFAAMLNLVRWLWFLITSALWILPEDSPAVTPDTRTQVGGDMFLNIILFAVILIMLFSIGVHRRRGIWTTLQPWMGGVIPPLAVRPGAMYVVPQMQQPMVFHQSPYPQNGMPPVQYQAPGQHPQQYQMPYVWQGSLPTQQHQQSQHFQAPGQDARGMMPHAAPASTAEVAQQLGKHEGAQNTQEVKDETANQSMRHP